MIASGLKKLANENGMKISNGIAYGDLKGYAATLSEGSGWKRIALATKFPNTQSLDNLKNALMAYNLTREYRVREIKYLSDGISIIFNDTMGTMKKMYAFIDLFFPLLDESGASKSNICIECGYELGSDVKWKLIDGAVALPMHESCAQKMINDIAYEKEEQAQNDTGNYLSGTLGAMIGSLIGSLLWALVLYMGYLAAPVGFVIGWLADKGYELLHGKNGKGKVAVLILAVIFGVIAGTYISAYAELAVAITSGELSGYGLVFSDIPSLILLATMEDPTYFVANIGMGLLFAALGVYSLIKKTNRDVSGTKVVDLN